MRIRWRKFTNEYLRLGSALGRNRRHVWILSVGILLTGVLVNFPALEGQKGPTEWVDPTAPGRNIQSRHAPAAFQKIEGQGATGESPATDHKKTGEKTGAARHSEVREVGYAHVEVNLSRQVLLVVDDSSHIVKTLPISSGSGKWFTSEGSRRRAVTPRGRFTIYRKVAGWRKSPLGMLYYPNYINEGIAIHGSPSVPSRPSSHGCIRIPMRAAKEFSEMAPIGTIVLVY